jgi:hypothetical protein
MLVVAVNVVQAPNDKQQLAPMLGQISALPKQLGQVETLLADPQRGGKRIVRHSTNALQMGHSDDPTPLETMTHQRS